ncbi:MAG: hypothetical protein P0111_11115 [Nitrospira sp.]|nr:hypothetical protein [Nitrospira sp.]
MTQDLVVGALLTGLVGLIWAMAVVVLWGEEPDHATSAPEVTPQRDDIDKTSSTRRTIAA